MNMNKLVSVIVAVVALVAATFYAPDAQAQRHPGSLGVGIGTSTIAAGLSVKRPAGPTALQLTAGCWRDGCSGVAGSVDMLMPRAPLVGGQAAVLAWNFGFGGAIGVADDTFAAAGSFVLGLELIFRDLPFDVVGEWRPTVSVLPGTDFKAAHFGGHIRFYP